MKVAVIGATGAVGREMTRILEERRFPVEDFVPLASARSVGRTVSFAGRDHEVRELTVDAAAGVDVAFVSAGATTSRAFLPAIVGAHGTVCIDNSSAFRMDPGCPLVVPDVNPEALEGWPRPGVIAVPNCTTIVAVLPLGPLHRAAGLRSLVVSSYQAVSGAGQKGTRELAEQVEKLAGQIESLGHPDRDTLPTGEVFTKQIAFNVVAQIGEFEPDGFTGEEVKIMAEPKKILSAPDLQVIATSVRVPVVTGHAVSLLAEFDRSIDVAEARALLADAPGVTLMDDPAAGVFPSPLDAAGEDGAYVGRIRQVPGRDDALALFSCADNLRAGAALDAVQIAERLFPS
ncbi:MAG: aspartate-semialdehyde dehydrogenase [Actinomycetota bacterium]|nr:aspartate-semialdehyde dehydrogenase [Actinomycetota bacterium]